MRRIRDKWGSGLEKSERPEDLTALFAIQNFLICAQDRTNRLPSAFCCIEHKALRRSASRRHSSRLSMRRSMYPTSNSFVLLASFSSARKRSNSMRNNVATAPDRICCGIILRTPAIPMAVSHPNAPNIQPPPQKTTISWTKKILTNLVQYPRVLSPRYFCREIKAREGMGPVHAPPGVVHPVADSALPARAAPRLKRKR